MSEAATLGICLHMKPSYRLRTKHRPQLLYAMMQALAGEDSRISFEGRISKTDLVKMDGAQFEETDLLRRGTLQPQLDFVVLPLTSVSLPAIVKAIDSKVAFSGYAGIVHVQIEKHGRLLLPHTITSMKIVLLRIQPCRKHY